VVSLELSTPTAVRLRLLDLQGAVVHTYVDEVLPTGTWHARMGDPVPAGTYRVVLTVAGRTLRARLPLP
jgi:hypothetical protein